MFQTTNQLLSVPLNIHGDTHEAFKVFPQDIGPQELYAQLATQRNNMCNVLFVRYQHLTFIGIYVYLQVHIYLYVIL